MLIARRMEGFGDTTPWYTKAGQKIISAGKEIISNVPFVGVFTINPEAYEKKIEQAPEAIAWATAAGIPAGGVGMIYTGAAKTASYIPQGFNYALYQTLKATGVIEGKANAAEYSYKAPTLPETEIVHTFGKSMEPPISQSDKLTIDLSVADKSLFYPPLFSPYDQPEQAKPSFNIVPLNIVSNEPIAAPTEKVLTGEVFTPDKVTALYQNMQQQKDAAINRENAYEIISGTPDRPLNLKDVGDIWTGAIYTEPSYFLPHMAIESGNVNQQYPGG